MLRSHALLPYTMLKSAKLETPLGPMLAISDDSMLYFLAFAHRTNLAKEIAHLEKRTGFTIIPGTTAPIQSIKSELHQYFAGTLITFKTPLFIATGTPFQQQVWQELQKIPCGHTCSYQSIAHALGKPKAYRAVARANSANQLAIIIPCHRVINTNGQLCGYSGGIERKHWLITHEKNLRPTKTAK